VAGAKAGAEKALAKLKAVCGEVKKYSTEVHLPLLFWQAPWFFDDSTKHAAKKVLSGIAHQHVVWWSFDAADQQAKSAQAGCGVASVNSPLMSLKINHRIVKVVVLTFMVSEINAKPILASATTECMLTDEQTLCDYCYIHPATCHGQQHSNSPVCKNGTLCRVTYFVSSCLLVLRCSHQLQTYRAVIHCCSMQVVKGDITVQTVAAIVNAANSQLWHSGGVAEHISRAAGPNFQAMCNMAVAATPQKQVDVGCCVVTDAEELPCSKVIHAVGPNFAGIKKLANSIVAPRSKRAMSCISLIDCRLTGTCRAPHLVQMTARQCNEFPAHGCCSITALFEFGAVDFHSG